MRRQQRRFPGLMGLLGILLFVALPASAQDFTWSGTAHEGMRLSISHPTGMVLVQGSSGDAVEVEADYHDDAYVEVRSTKRTVYVEVLSDHGRPGEVELTVRIPKWVEVRIEGMELEVEVIGVEAPVDVEVLSGDVLVEGGRDEVNILSVHGRVEVRGAIAELDLESTNEDIRVRDCEGRLSASSVNGDLRVENLRSEEVDVVTTRGDIVFDGDFSAVGDYNFSTHGGDVVLTIPRDASLAVDVSTYRGELDQDFDVEVSRSQKGKRSRFTLGDGEGRLHIETFDGDISLYDAKRGRGKRG